MEILTATFIGHRETEENETLKKYLYALIENMIIDGVGIFLFGSRSKFNDLCYNIVSDLRGKYSYIKRIYIRAEYPYINDDYKEYLLKRYEDTYFPEKALKSGKAVYIIRNCEMIDKSDVCIFYYDLIREGGTKIAYEYAIRKRRSVVNVFDCKI